MAECSATAGTKQYFDKLAFGIFETRQDLLLLVILVQVWEPAKVRCLRVELRTHCRAVCRAAQQ